MVFGDIHTISCLEFIKKFFVKSISTYKYIHITLNLKKNIFNRTKLSSKNVSVFAIAGESFNEKTLLSYTNEEKGHILSGQKSENLFISTLDKASF